VNLKQNYSIRLFIYQKLLSKSRIIIQDSEYFKEQGKINISNDFSPGIPQGAAII
jgi:hypothetical protein